MKKSLFTLWVMSVFSYNQVNQGLVQTFAIQLVFPGLMVQIENGQKKAPY